MTIIKIKNPIGRWLVGLIVILALITTGATICYFIGNFVNSSLLHDNFSIFEYIWLGVFAIAAGICVPCVIYGIYQGAKALGEKFFDP